jgi:ribosomal protein L11 methylase PrmA
VATAHPAACDINVALLVIPGSAAFGTGEHGTTAMSLSFLGTTDPVLEPGLVAYRSWEWRRNSCFGGKMPADVVGIDHDDITISMAKSSARMNKFAASVFN